MNTRDIDRAAAIGPKELSLRDVTIVLFAIATIILANVGVVRALDLTLDAIHR
ncbi:MAG: hypothetical protein ACR650_01120 [Methylocystis sp.]